MLRIAGFAFFALLCLSGAAFANVGSDRDHPTREVLPDTVVPTHYDLALAPDARALTFRGKVTIAITVRAATADVVLNAVGLAFEHVRVDGGVRARIFGNLVEQSHDGRRRRAGHGLEGDGDAHA